MKNTIKAFILAAAAVSIAASCAKEANVETTRENGKLHFTVTTAENATIAAKSYLDNDLEGNYTPKWSKGDAIAVFTGSIVADTKPDGTLSNQNEDGATAKFEGTLASAESGEFKAVSPAARVFKGYAADDGAEILGVNLGDPDNAYVQNPTYETIDPDCDILVSKPTGYTSDGGTVVLNDIYFKRLMSVLKVNVSGPESLNSEKIRNFTLTSSTATLAGRAKIDVTNAKVAGWTVGNKSVKAVYSSESAMPLLYDAYNITNSVYLVVNPTTLASGETLTFSGETDNYNFSKEVTLASDIVFPESQIAVINLTLETTHLTKKSADVWAAAALEDIAADDEVVITMKTSSAYYALTSAKGTSAAPTAVSVAVASDKLTDAPAAELVWNISNVNGTLTIYPNGQTDKWLYTTNDNDGVRVGGTNDNKDFTIDGNYLKNTTTKRYVGVYTTKLDWRCYTSINDNIKDQTLCFFVKENNRTALEAPANLSVSEAKIVAWDAVSGAASYKVTIGTQAFFSETNSYDASAIEDEYYDVAVVAVPSDTDNHKNSAAATLTAAKFGTPTLTTPELKEGAIDEYSITVTWTVDARATGGYVCEIYADDSKADEDIVETGSVTFSSLKSGQTYTVKVYADAVSGDKAYAASETATIELKTKPTYQVKDVTAAGTYTITGLTVYAVPNASNAIVGDGTGYILLYKSSHGLAVGDMFDAAGSVVTYNGVWEYDAPTISNKATGDAPAYSGAVEATEDWLTAYASASSVQYIHAKGTQSGRDIKVGGQTLYLSAENTATDAKPVEAYGFVYGYSSNYSNSSFVATSIAVDESVPTLSIDNNSKNWGSTETDAFVVNVTVNAAGDWTVSPTSLDWAAVAVDKTAGTITVTPNGENSSETAYEATLTVTHTSDASLTKTISLSQAAAGTAVEKYYVKVTSADDLTDGQYLIVYETGQIAFDGSLQTLDAVSNSIKVTISDSKIKSDETVDKSAFSYSSTAKTLKSASGYYIGMEKNDNGMKSSTSTTYSNTITISNGNANIVSSNAYLRYNASSGQTRFRYFKSSTYSNQKAIQLYKLEN